MAKTIKIVIIEDEPISSAYLKKLISETSFEHTIVDIIDSVSASLVFFASNTNFDLVFMDIHLGDGTCFDIMNEIPIEKPIIFCTTFDTYALEAFKYNSIDYIIKPAKLNNVETALKKYLSLKQKGEKEYVERMDSLMQAFVQKKFKKRFLVRNKNKLSIIDIKDVICFYSDKGYTHLVDKSGKSHIIDFTLERLEDLLNPNSFFRINRKMTVSINYILSVEDYFNHRLKIKMKTRVSLELVVSRNRVREFKSWLKGIS